jgi:general secretion pathway protein M
MKRLSTREKRILCMGGCFLLILFALKGILLPAMAEKERLEKRVAVAGKTLQEMVSMQERYQRMGLNVSREMHTRKNREKGFTLFSFLDRLALKSGVKENIVHMKPDSRKQDKGAYTIFMVKVKLESLYLKEFMDFLYLIETAGKGVHISGLSLTKTGKENRLLDAVLDAWMLVQEDAA